MKNVNNTISNTFLHRLLSDMGKSICNLTDQFFELYNQLPIYENKYESLYYQYREFDNASAMRKTGWFFLVSILLPCLLMFDYASIKAFLDYLSISAGGVIGFVIKIIGGAMFLLFEIGIGFLLLNSKDKPILHILAVILAIAMICIPAYLIYTTYLISPQKTDLLYYKTIALILVSVIIHILFFLLVAEIWAGINYYLYKLKLRKVMKNDPSKHMETIRAELQKFYPDFDQYRNEIEHSKMLTLLHNRAWFLKEKLQNGNTNDDYDLSDYDPKKSYAPIPTLAPAVTTIPTT